MRRSHILSAAEVVERGGKARHAIARLIKLVESTLDAARLDAGQIEIRSQACDLGQLAAEICNRQNELPPQRKIIVQLAGRNSAIAFCDPVHAENILVNLLSNAVKYSLAGTPISVSVVPYGDRVECSVSNHGGIACPAERDALFERYFRGRNAEGRPGIGIGLYMARTLARMQGGDVRLEGSDEERVTFTLVLPRARAHLEDGHAASRLEEPA
jgi:signal transduction histidine kinase